MATWGSELLRGCRGNARFFGQQPKTSPQLIRRSSKSRTAGRTACLADDQRESTGLPRRDLFIGIAALTAVSQAPPAQADGSDLRKFLQKRQEKYAIAPLRVGQQKLQKAAELLASAADAASRADALKIIRGASFNCYTYEARTDESLEGMVSLVQQGIPALADPCTYRLIAKNVTLLVPDRESHLRDAVDLRLSALLRSFNLLDEAVEGAMDGDELRGAKVDERLRATQENLSAFEDSIKQCLHMA